jgi:hypothetical protein
MSHLLQHALMEAIGRFVPIRVQRWTFVALGLWGDFIPNIGGWLNGTGQPDWVLGYAFRWLGRLALERQRIALAGRL